MMFTRSNFTAVNRCDDQTISYQNRVEWSQNKRAPGWPPLKELSDDLWQEVGPATLSEPHSTTLEFGTRYTKRPFRSWVIVTVGGNAGGYKSKVSNFSFIPRRKSVLQLFDSTIESTWTIFFIIDRSSFNNFWTLFVFSNSKLDGLIHLLIRTAYRLDSAGSLN